MEKMLYTGATGTTSGEYRQFEDFGFRSLRDTVEDALHQSKPFARLKCIGRTDGRIQR